jgi:hypothetical protein
MRRCLPALYCQITVRTHATVKAPGVPHDWMLLRMVLEVHGMILMELMHHTGRLRHASVDAAGWVPSGGVLRFA